MTEKFCNTCVFNKGYKFLQINKKKIRKPSRKTGKRFERISSQKIFKWSLIIFISYQ